MQSAKRTHTTGVANSDPDRYFLTPPPVAGAEGADGPALMPRLLTGAAGDATGPPPLRPIPDEALYPPEDGIELGGGAEPR